MKSGKIYGISLKILIILFSLIVITAPAVAVAPPIILEGNLMVDGSPASAGTEVTVVADGQTVAETTVTNEGLFGNERSNRLGVSSDYGLVTIYVDGVETTTLDLSSYQVDDMVSLDLSATSPTPTESSESSGGGGGFSSATTTQTTAVEDSQTGVEEATILESTTESTVEEEIANEVPEGVDSGFSSVTGLGGIAAIIGLILIGGVVVSYGKGAKK